MTDTTDHPSRRAGLRDELRRAVCEAEGFAWDSDMLEPDEYGDHADAVLAVLYREWPWLRAEAEDAAPAVVSAVDRAALVEAAAQAIRDSNGSPEALEWWRTHPQLIPAHVYADAVLAVLPAPADRAAEELAKHVARAIFALKSPTPPGSEHYRSGWDDGLEAAMDAARDAVLRLAAVPVVGVAADTTPAGERPRCAYCGLPHDLTPSMALACASIRAMVDTVAPAVPGPVVPAQPGGEA